MFSLTFAFLYFLLLLYYKIKIVIKHDKRFIHTEIFMQTKELTKYLSWKSFNNIHDLTVYLFHLHSAETSCG